jgi:hypothetical protein
MPPVLPAGECRRDEDDGPAAEEEMGTVSKPPMSRSLSLEVYALVGG